MNKNTTKIRAGIHALVQRPYEVISGTVVSGSIDAAAYTATVQPSDDGEPIKGVRLHTITGSGEGMVLIPADGADVVIASIDGPGEWTVIKMGEITKAVIKIGNVTLEMDGTRATLQNHSVTLDISGSVFKMNTAAESLYTFLSDLLNYLMALTVPTPSGVSGVPVNITNFSALRTRLDNLLES